MRLLVPIVEALGARLLPIEQGDHSFHVPVRSGKTDAQVLDEALNATVHWMREILSAPLP